MLIMVANRPYSWHDPHSQARDDDNRHVFTEDSTLARYARQRRAQHVGGDRG